MNAPPTAAPRPLNFVEAINILCPLITVASAYTAWRLIRVDPTDGRPL